MAEPLGWTARTGRTSSQRRSTRRRAAAGRSRADAYTTCGAARGRLFVHLCHRRTRNRLAPVVLALGREVRVRAAAAVGRRRRRRAGHGLRRTSPGKFHQGLGADAASRGCSPLPISGRERRTRDRRCVAHRQGSHRGTRAQHHSANRRVDVLGTGRKASGRHRFLIPVPSGGDRFV